MSSNQSSGAAFPFSGNLLENLELMRKTWGGAFPQMPGFGSLGGMPSVTSMMVPTLDVNELDKRITDLRAVEQWLNLNASMLRATIQAFEVQRNTIATLQALGGAMAAPLGAAAPGQAKAAPGAPSGKGPSAEARAPDGVEAASQRKPAQPAPQVSRRTARQPAQGAPSATDAPLNPAAWWSNLQDQFARIAAAAAGDTSGAGRSARPPAKPPSRKPRTKPVE